MNFEFILDIRIYLHAKLHLGRLDLPTATPRAALSPCPVCGRMLTAAQMLGHSRLCKADGGGPTPPRPTSTAGALPSSEGLARVASAPSVGSSPPARFPTRKAAPGSAARGDLGGGGGMSASAARLPLPRPSPSP